MSVLNDPATTQQPAPSATQDAHAEHMIPKSRLDDVLAKLDAAQKKADALEKTPRVEQTEMSAISSALVRETSTVGTSPVDDVTPTVVATTEMVVWSVIQNNEASGGDDVCWTTVARGTACTASGLTCSGAATDGIRIRPLESQTVKYAPASVRLCIVASAAATPFHVSSEVIP